MRIATIASFCAACASLAACSTYHDQLVRSQRAYEQNQHEQTLGLLRDLERDLSSLPQPEKAQYSYLRGMTDYRVGYRADARHWLALAKAYDDNSPGVLPADWKARLGEALDEMNTVVYDDGLAALAKVPRAADEAEATPPPTKAKPKKSAPSSAPTTPSALDPKKP